MGHVLTERMSQSARCHAADVRDCPSMEAIVQSSRRQSGHQRRVRTDQSLRSSLSPASSTVRARTLILGVKRASCYWSILARMARRSASCPAKIFLKDRPKSAANCRTSGSPWREASLRSTPCGGSPVRVRKRSGGCTGINCFQTAGISGVPSREYAFCGRQRYMVLGQR